MPTDAELLVRYVEDRDEAAFRDLVQRHFGLVYSAALRRTGGRTHLAEEIAQTVFSDLARKASTLIHHPALVGWLYRSTRYAAIAAGREELRRHKLAQTLTAMPDASTPPEPHVDWEHLRPVIDDAMDQLKERDRQIVLLRYFDTLSFAEVGARLDLNENAARMRAERALDQLRRHLSRRGVTSTSAALSMLLAHPAFAAAPAGLAATVAGTALASAPVGGAAGVVALLFMSKLTASALTATLAIALTTVVWTSTVPGVSAEELAALRHESARLTQAIASGASATSLATVADEFAVQTTAVARAVEQRLAQRGDASSAPSPASDSATAAAEDGRHRNRGQDTPRNACMSFAWASDAGDVDALSKLIWFDGNGREKALAVHATMPESLRVQYPTPETLYGFFLAAHALVGPPPGADVLSRMEVVELRPDRAAVRRPGSTQNHHEYQQTAEGWKWAIDERAVPLMPRILNNEALTNSSHR